MEREELEALVEEARRSDPDAWEVIYRHSYARLFNYARRRLPDREQAVDAVGETFARAYEDIHRFRWRGAGLTGWLYGILRNVVLEMARSGRRESPSLELDHPETGTDASDGVIAAEEAKAVRDAFASLPSEDQELLELRVIGGLDSKAVGAVVGKRDGAVRMAQSRALQKLRKLMEEQGHE
ncbi:MAG: sigma-70 family RNA polymerase sigma factor [Actinomycetota bacterium]|nr:sigma-70 family RNA polymerase sigma factor [Actinomycetota bacterium]